MPKRKKAPPKQWPEAVLDQGSDGKLKRVALNKLNMQLYALTFGPHTIPPIAQNMLKRKMRLNYNQYKRSLQEQSDMYLQNM